MSEKTNPPEEITTLPAPVVQKAPARSVLPVVATLVSLIALSVALVPMVTKQAAVPEQIDYTSQIAELKNSIPNISALTQQIAVLQQRVAELEAAAATPPAVAGTTNVDLSPLQARLAALEARPVGADTSALEAAIAKLQQEIGSEARVDDAQKTLMVAALQLVTAWQAGQAFEAPWLSALAAASVADPTLALALDDAAPTLLPWRDKGIMRLSKLTADFPAMAQQVVIAAAPKGEGWWQQSLNRIKGLVVIRRQGDAVAATDTATDAILARAEVRLSRADLAGAVAELETLNEVAAPAAAEWLAAASARLQVDALSAKLAQRAANGLLAENVALPSDDEGIMPDAGENAVPEASPDVLEPDAAEAAPEATPAPEVAVP